MSYRNLYPAYKVFIFGVDVTEDVTSCSFTHSDGRAPDTAEIVLNNLEDKYVVTEEDIHILYSDIPLDGSAEAIGSHPTETSPSDVDSIIQTGTTNVHDTLKTSTEEESGDSLTRLVQRTQKALNEHFKTDKGRVLRKKIGIRQKVVQPTLKDLASGHKTQLETLSALAGEACTYHFQVGDSIFHSNDPVRIFWRDPSVPTDWYFAFTGYVSDYIDHIGASGETTLTIRCEDVLRTLRYARITTNPSVFDIQSVLTEYDESFLSFYQNIFSELTLTEAIGLMLFGSTATELNDKLSPIGAKFNASSTIVQPTTTAGNQRVSVNGSVDVRTSKSATGSYNFSDSRIYIFGNPPEGEAEPDQSAGVPHEKLDSLAKYMALVDTKVYPEDLYLLSDTSDAASISVDEEIARIKNADGTFDVEKVIDVIGARPDLFPIEGRFVALLPASLGQGLSRKIMTRDVSSGWAMVTTFTNRLQQIYDICNRIDFSFYANGKGDILLEMPLCDFHPHDFGQVRVTVDASDLPRSVLFSPSARGPYGQRLTVLRRSITSWERSFSDEHVRTMFRVPYHPIQQSEAFGTSDDKGFPPAVVSLFDLIPQFGVRMEMAQTWSYIATREAAAAYGLLQLNKWNADARTAKVGMIMRMGIGPNRPVQFLVSSPTTSGSLRRAFIATVRNVHYAIQWGHAGSAEMSLGVNYMRGWDGQLTNDKKDRLYSPLGGFASQPFNYAVLFKLVDPPTSTKQIEVPAAGVEAGPTRALAERVPARHLLALTIADRLRAKGNTVRNISESHGKLKLDPSNPGDVAIAKIANSVGDPHRDENSLAFDISGDSEANFLSLIEPGTDFQSTQDPRWRVSNHPADPALQKLGARIILERGGSNGDNVHIQWPEKNEHKLLSWANDGKIPESP